MCRSINKVQGKDQCTGTATAPPRGRTAPAAAGDFEIIDVRCCSRTENIRTHSIRGRFGRATPDFLLKLSEE
jgi:hypothetical protein